MNVYYAYDPESRTIEEIRPDSKVRGSPSAMRVLLGILLTLSVMGACAFAWPRSDNLIAWGFSQGLVSESSIPAVQTALDFAFVVTGAASLLFNGPLLIWSAFGVCRWGPVQVVAGHMKAAISKLAAAIVGISLAALMVLRRGVWWSAQKLLAAGTLVYGAGRLLVSGIQLVWRIGLRAGLSILVAVLDQIGMWVGWLAMLLATGFKAFASIVAFIIGSAVLLAIVIASHLFIQSANAAATAWAVIAVASRYIVMPLLKLANATLWTAGKVLSGVSRVLDYGWSVVAAIYRPIAGSVLRILRVFDSGFRYAWETAVGVANICWTTVSTSTAYLWTGIGHVAKTIGQTVVKAWGIACWVADLVWGEMRKVFWLAGKTFARVARIILTVLGLMRSVATTATQHVGHLLASVWRMAGKIAGYTLYRLWTATTWAFARTHTIARLLYTGVAAVFKGLGMATAIVARGLISVLRYGRIGITTALRCLGIGLWAVSWLVWSALAVAGLGLFMVLRYAAFGLWSVVRFCLVAMSVALGYLWTAVSTASKYIGNKIAIVAHYLKKVIGYALRQIWASLGWVSTRIKALVRYVFALASAALGQLRRATVIAGRGMIIVIRRGWLPVSVVLKYIGAGAVAAGLLLWAGLATLGAGLLIILRYAYTGVRASTGLLWAGLAMLGAGILLILRYAYTGVRASTGLLWAGLAALGAGILIILRYTFAGIQTVGKSVSRTVQTALGYIMAGFRPVVKGLVLALHTLGTGVSYIAGVIFMALAAMVRFLWVGLATLAKGTGILLYQMAGMTGGGLAFIWQGSRMAIHPLVSSASSLIGYLRLGISSLYLAVAWTVNSLMLGTWTVSKAVFMTPVFATRTAITGFAALPDAGSAGLWMIKNRKGVQSMKDSNLNRERFFSLVVTMLVFFTAGAFAIRVLWPAPPPPTVEVVHWATGHLFRNDMLSNMAERFNQAEHRTESGKLIVVKAQNNPSSIQADDLLSRVTTGVRLPRECCPGASTPHPDPTIVTLSSAHWLIRVNQTAGRKVVDPDSARSIATAYIGIVTYREMAECLGWPEKEIGYQDIIDLRADPQGWKKYDCAKPSWGERPLVAFTDPKTSSTGRSVHLALYAMAAGKLPKDLTLEDVSDAAVVQYVREFQGLIDHYFIGTTVMNTKIHQGPQFGQFFLMPEDNLIHLYEGTERAYFGGIRKSAPPIAPNSMVMIYPKEGSMARKNCACIVDAPWVTPEEVEGANKWIDFLQEDEQQLEFMDAGFRPVTELSLTHPRSKITMSYGLTPKVPAKTMNVALIDPVVADAIDRSWDEVKRPGIVTFVVDTSGSMLGNKLKQAKDGLIRSLDNMAGDNRVGYVSFDDAVNAVIPVDHLGITGPNIVDEIRATRARGETALYDAIKVGVEMTDAAQGPIEAIRAVVVLTDGQANKGTTELDDIIEIMSRAEKPMVQYRGFTGEETGVDSLGTTVGKQHMLGTRLRIETAHPIQIFFIGIGDDADLDVGRMLAGATYAEFQGVTEEDLANLLAEFSGYF